MAGELQAAGRWVKRFTLDWQQRGSSGTRFGVSHAEHYEAVYFIAESMEVIGLLSFVRQCLGWMAERQEHIDQALQSLRDWAAQRAELVIVGDGDLRPVVRRLHNLVIGADMSFTWYEQAEGATDAAAAVKTAATGTLCVEMRRQADAVAVVAHRVPEIEVDNCLVIARPTRRVSISQIKCLRSRALEPTEPRNRWQISLSPGARWASLF